MYCNCGFNRSARVRSFFLPRRKLFFCVRRSLKRQLSFARARRKVRKKKQSNGHFSTAVVCAVLSTPFWRNQKANRRSWSWTFEKRVRRNVDRNSTAETDWSESGVCTMYTVYRRFDHDILLAVFPYNRSAVVPRRLSTATASFPIDRRTRFCNHHKGPDVRHSLPPTRVSRGVRGLNV